MKTYLKSLTGLLLGIGITFGALGEVPAIASNLGVPSALPAAKIGPTYQYCLERWQPDYIKYIEMRDDLSELRALNAWTRCLGKKFEQQCERQVTDLAATATKLQVWMNKTWTYYYNAYIACAKRVYTVAPPCKINVKNLEKPSILGYPAPDFILTANEGSWSGIKGETVFTWYRNGKIVKDPGEDPTDYELQKRDIGQTIKVRIKVLSSCGNKAFFAESAPIKILKKEYLKGWAKKPSGPILRKITKAQSPTPCYEVVLPKWLLSDWQPPRTEMVGSRRRLFLNGTEFDSFYLGSHQICAHNIPKELWPSYDAVLEVHWEWKFAGYQPLKYVVRKDFPQNWFPPTN
jgi:hypothetical protein